MIRRLSIGLKITFIYNFFNNKIVIKFDNFSKTQAKETYSQVKETNRRLAILI